MVGPKAGGHHTMWSLSRVFSPPALLVVLLEEQPRQTSTSWSPQITPNLEWLIAQRVWTENAGLYSLPAQPPCLLLLVPATLDLPKPHACSSRTTHTLKEAPLPSSPLLFFSLSLQLIFSPPFFFVSILPDLPSCPRSLPWCPSYCTVLWLCPSCCPDLTELHSIWLIVCASHPN